MKTILLDACVPRKLGQEFKTVIVKTAHEMGWSDLDDGELLDMMAGQFDAFVTVDKGIPNQQKLDHRDFAILIMRAKSNRLADLMPLVEKVEKTLEDCVVSQVYTIS